MDRRGFFGKLVGGVAAAVAAKAVKSEARPEQVDITTPGYTSDGPWFTTIPPQKLRWSKHSAKDGPWFPVEDESADPKTLTFADIREMRESLVATPPPVTYVPPISPLRDAWSKGKLRLSADDLDAIQMSMSAPGEGFTEYIYRGYHFVPEDIEQIRRTQRIWSPPAHGMVGATQTDTMGNEWVWGKAGEDIKAGTVVAADAEGHMRPFTEDGVSLADGVVQRDWAEGESGSQMALRKGFGTIHVESGDVSEHMLCNVDCTTREIVRGPWHEQAELSDEGAGRGSSVSERVAEWQGRAQQTEQARLDDLYGEWSG